MGEAGFNIIPHFQAAYGETRVNKRRWCPKKYAAYFLIITHNHYLHNETLNQKP